MKYTDEQIKQALLNISYGGHSCAKCKFDNGKGDDRCGLKNCKIGRLAADLINRQEAEIERLNRFKAFFESLCEFDLEVLGYTEDGDTIPFNVLYENAVKEMVGESDV